MTFTDAFLIIGAGWVAAIGWIIVSSVYRGRAQDKRRTRKD